jgi:CheY-like chemotaxis protein
VVEDDEEIRDLIQDVLEEQGYDVVPAGNGMQALDYLRAPHEARPALIILDLMMPLVTGWQVLQEMRSDPALADLPVVVLTAVDRDRPRGVAALLRKPFNMVSLVDTIRSFAPTPAAP